MTVVTINPLKVRPLIGSISSPIDAGEATHLGRWVYVGDDGRVYETNATALETAGVQVGIIVAAGRATADGSVVENEKCAVVWFGRVAMPGAELDPGAQYFLADETEGEKGLMADAAGTVARRTGNPEASDIFFVNPGDVSSISYGGE